jgi:hypothetical protein
VIKPRTGRGKGMKRICSACEGIINACTNSGCEKSVRNLHNSLRYVIKISPDLLLKEDAA